MAVVSGLQLKQFLEGLGFCLDPVLGSSREQLVDSHGRSAIFCRESEEEQIRDGVGVENWVGRREGKLHLVRKVWKN